MSQGRDIQPSVLAKASRGFSFTSTAESSDRTNNPSLFCFGDWTLKVKQILGRVHCAFIADSTRENSADAVRFSNYYRIIKLSIVVVQEAALFQVTGLIVHIRS